jgi:quinate dehydrogenase (quinone)
MDMAPGSTPRRLVTLLRWLLAILMLVIGLAIGIPGIKLITLGGSVWFTAMGIVMLIAAILILRNRPGGLILYALGFIVSIIWAIYDAGWAFWPCSHACLPLPCWHFWRHCCGHLCAPGRR